MGLVESSPPLEEQITSESVQKEYSMQHPLIPLYQKKTGDWGQKPFKTPQASTAEPSHPDTLPPLDLFIQRQTFATEPSSLSILEPKLGTGYVDIRDSCSSSSSSSSSSDDPEH